jgi:hypothetical protein
LGDTSGFKKFTMQVTNLPAELGSAKGPMVYRVKLRDITESCGWRAAVSKVEVLKPNQNAHPQPAAGKSP